MNERYIYLFGGNPSLKEANREFVEKAGGSEARIALLIMNTAKWEKFLPVYTTVWEELGISRYDIIIPDGNSILDNKKTEEILKNATGIYIGGGDTYLYHNHYVNSPVKEMIMKQYNEGVPVAGCSAGALIILEKSFISPEESKNKTIDYIDGIGLLKELCIGVHYTEENQKPHLIKALQQYGFSTGYGIDEEACAVFKNEKFEKTIGQDVHYLQQKVEHGF
ncbi:MULTISPECIES: Type 1 glutamine amidotransferase-like domain-containing protein [unclassified Bacillus (in: firmicutes)]|uniref:Type 1 glutamine amidotransferase-like domain-containing protein n=1 Tax=unclassified Bacillus (in: firmicutes) TaxID=185979 RepID=UPI0008E7C6E9|nr:MULTISPECIES: Type 1 glutamine amidotransferase-like domain-containing protein [unclassified Bacillus (in: firmicutes)]SFA88268.1 cyanophycinase [Bacillus sp. UNCCL13]SFQ84557.1 cyanophycinase [Bacillus sp. cl95]